MKTDPSCAEIIKPYLRGRDINRWIMEPQDEWIILMKSSTNQCWSWSDSTEPLAENLFKKTFPTLYNHLKPFEKKLRKRSDKGNYWWELRACAYYDDFKKAKIIYQVIQFHPQYALDTKIGYGNDKTYFLPTADLYLLGLLNSPLMWWHNWRYFGHMKDDALNPANFKMETLPIAPPTDEIRSQVEPIVTRLIEITQTNQESVREVLDWLRMEQSIEKLGNKLEDFASLDCDQFVQEIKKRKPKDTGLNPKALKEVREVYNDYAPKIQTHRAEALSLEIQLSDLVNQAYGLTPEEIDLMWKTAPPRMPIPNPNRKGE